MIEGNEVFGFYRVFVAFLLFSSVGLSVGRRLDMNRYITANRRGICAKQKYKNDHDITKGTDDNENRTRILRQPCF